MTAYHETTRRDPSGRSGEITDAVRNGPPSAHAQDGNKTGGPIPARRRRRFVPRAEFTATARTAPDLCRDTWRADQDATAEQEADDPYAR
ncbi:hypothetical protein [Streptomyces albus]|uniref:hypothetical protein n=1 Tax=Streptomyces albus TaxID=1888 RepID=UPI0004C78BB8|nr:hypothetical protein [Streptomyces albus]